VNRIHNALVQNPDAYFDTTVNEWHMKTFPWDATAIDVDLVGTCRSCNKPLYMVEATENPAKYSYILQEMARRCSCVAYVVWHQDKYVTEAQQVYPHGRTRKIPWFELEFEIKTIRAKHKRKCNVRKLAA